MTSRTRWRWIERRAGHKSWIHLVLPLSVLIQLAYNVNDLQLDGGPSWVRSYRYEVDARAGGPATFEQMRPMLQSLLADRFKLTLRRETRQLPAYDLMPAGDGLKIAVMKEGSCVPPERAVPLGPISCAGVRKQLGAQRQILEVAGIPMAKLIELLSDEVGRVVVDRTDFTDRFSVRLEFAPFAEITHIKGHYSRTGRVREHVKNFDVQRL